MFSHRNHWLRSAAFAADLGKFIFGYAMVFPSALIPQLEEEDHPRLPLNIDQISWFGVRAACLFLIEYYLILNYIENETINNTICCI